MALKRNWYLPIDNQFVTEDPDRILPRFAAFTDPPPPPPPPSPDLRHRDTQPEMSAPRRRGRGGGGAEVDDARQVTAPVPVSGSAVSDSSVGDGR